MLIDAHQHFWALNRHDYGWLTPQLGPIYRDFAPADLAPHLARHGIEGTVLVQAAPTIAETHYLLELATRTPFVMGVVGWVDMAAHDASLTIAELASNPRLVGIRPMIQDIDDPDWMLDGALSSAFESIVAHDIAFDALVLPRHLANLLRLSQRHPALRIVIDHGAKPTIGNGGLEPWAGAMARLAELEGMHCKLSGLVTQAGDGWSVERLRPYVDHLLERFGPARLIWGSDWPVAGLAATYSQWWATTDALLDGFADADRASILGGNAERFYGLQRRVPPAGSARTSANTVNTND